MNLIAIAFFLGLLIVLVLSPSLLSTYVLTYILTFLYTIVAGWIVMPLYFFYRSGLKIRFLVKGLQKYSHFFIGIFSLLSGVVSILILNLLGKVIGHYNFDLGLILFVILLGLNYHNRMKNFQLHQLLGEQVDLNIKNERFSLVGHLAGLFMGWVLFV